MALSLLRGAWVWQARGKWLLLGRRLQSSALTDGNSARTLPMPHWSMNDDHSDFLLLPKWPSIVPCTGALSSGGLDQDY